jgi:hypothetical protein
MKLLQKINSQEDFKTGCWSESRDWTDPSSPIPMCPIPMCQFGRMSLFVQSHKSFGYASYWSRCFRRESVMR